MIKTSRTNRLAQETSPYLLQHQHNPIDWYPWGEEAIALARETGRPIFLSVGYSACHWCHVMERESFEDEEIAAYLNANFVSIKVDREERPDVDSIYMDAVQLMSGQGGWPMSVWLDHQLRPFFAGTYFPPEDRYGRPGFMSVLLELNRVWTKEPERIDAFGQDIMLRLEAMARPLQSEVSLAHKEVMAQLVARSAHEFDEQHGGFGGAPKFPAGAKLTAMMHLLGRDDSSDEERQQIQQMLDTTLVHMASGGMYDHIGGGFHRYSTDAQWLIPHFEKMLYDNASLIQAYTLRAQQTGHPFYKRIVRESIDYVCREMLDPLGGFWSSQDADTDGVEGKFFVWTPEMFDDALGDDAPRAAAYWGVTPEGNFEHGLSALHRLHTITDALGRQDMLSQSQLPGTHSSWARALFDIRQSRTVPGTDTKIIASWNGFMIRAFAIAGARFDSAWIDIATRAADFVFERMVESSDDGVQLYRIYKDGQRRFEAYLEDYASMALAMIALFEATADLQHLERAERLVSRMIRDFGDDEDGVFFTSAKHHQDLIVRQKDSFDGAIASGNGMALEALLRLWSWTGYEPLRARVDLALQTLHSTISRHPTACPSLLIVQDMHIAGMHQLIEVVDLNVKPDTQRFWRPHMTSLTVTPAQAVELGHRVPVLHGKTLQHDECTFYLCHRGVCQLPVGSLDELT